MLFDHPASEWLQYYQQNNQSTTWTEFLMVVCHRFDPDFCEDYVAQLSKLRQTSTMLQYQTDFETILNKVSDVSNETLISMFFAGLKQPVQRELTIRRPSSLQEEFALSRQLWAAHSESSGGGSRSLTPRDSRHTTTPLATVAVSHSRPDNSVNRTPSNHVTASQLSIVRVSAAERAERTRKELCWYCDKAWSRTHVCSKKFLALIGADDEDYIEETTGLEFEDDVDTMVIMGDVSTIYTLAPNIRPQSLHMTGSINDSNVSVLINGGSTHNFINPAVELDVGVRLFCALFSLHLE